MRAWLLVAGAAALAAMGCAGGDVAGEGTAENAGSQSQAISGGTASISITAKSDTEIDLAYSYSCEPDCATRATDPITAVTLSRISGSVTKNVSLPTVGGTYADKGLSAGTLYTYSVCFISKSGGAHDCASTQGTRTSGSPGGWSSGFGGVPGVSVKPNDGDSSLALVITSDHPYDHYNIQYAPTCGDGQTACGLLTQVDTDWVHKGGYSVVLGVGPVGNSGQYLVNTQGCDFTMWGNSVCGPWSRPVDTRAPTASGTGGAAMAAVPVVSAVTPSSGLPEGGTSVRIDGANFDTTGKTVVHFGQKNATSVTCASSTQCFATAPAGGGVANVVVGVGTLDSALGANTKYSYVPSVLSVTPSHGKAGDTVTIKGLGFSPAANAVSFAFGAYPATSVSCYPGPDCSVVVPPGGDLVDVHATVAGHTTGITSGDLFQYDAPTITSLSATSGPLVGGTHIDITGTNFAPAAAAGQMKAFFGTTPAIIACASPTLCTLSSPASTTPGPVHVSLTSFGIPSVPSSADIFTYRSQAALTQVSWDTTTSSVHVEIDGSAPAGGAVVSLASSNPNAVLPPSTVTIPAGMVGGTAAVTLVPTPAGGTATLTATYAGSSMSTPVSYVAWPLVDLEVGDLVLGANQSTTVTVNLNTPAPAGGAVVALSSSAPAAITVPASIVVPAGSHSANVTVTNRYSGASEKVTLGASYEGVTASRVITVPATACKVRTCPKGSLFNSDTCACEMP